MLKNFLGIVIGLILSIMVTIPCHAAGQITRRDFAVGWQISGPASGFSIKIPYQKDYYFQPVFSVAMSQKDVTTTGNYALGIRGVYNLERRQDFLPYIGAALGYSKNFEKSTTEDQSDSFLGYQGFFGVEYQKYLLRPALEVGIGGSSNSDGSFHAGAIYNLSIFYYF